MGWVGGSVIEGQGGGDCDGGKSGMSSATVASATARPRGHDHSVAVKATAAITEGDFLAAAAAVVDLAFRFFYVFHVLHARVGDSRNSRNFIVDEVDICPI